MDELVSKNAVLCCVEKHGYNDDPDTMPEKLWELCQQAVKADSKKAMATLFHCSAIALKGRIKESINKL